MPTIPVQLHCPACRHDLTGLPAADARDAGAGTELICPECGVATTIHAASDPVIPQKGWLYTALWITSALFLLSMVGCGIAVVGYLIWAAAGGLGPQGGP